MQKRTYQKYIIMILTLIWMGVIFWFSAQPATESAQMSGAVLGGLQKFLIDIPVFNSMLISGVAEHILRKGAHFLEYAVLGVLLLLCANSNLSEKWKKLRLPVALVSGILYACTDEWHQAFVPGRSAQVSDVILDGTGVCTGIIIVIAVLSCIGRKKEVY